MYVYVRSYVSLSGTRERGILRSDRPVFDLGKEFSSVPFRSVPFRSVPFRSVPFRSVPFRSVPFRSVPFRSVPFRSVPFRSVPFRAGGRVGGRAYMGIHTGMFLWLRPLIGICILSSIRSIEIIAKTRRFKTYIYNLACLLQLPGVPNNLLIIGTVY